MGGPTRAELAAEVAALRKTVERERAKGARLARSLTEAQRQQAATGEVLRTITQARADAQPVFETIADSAMRLLGAWSVAVFRYEEEHIRLAAVRGGLPASREVFTQRHQAPRRLTEDLPRDRAVRTLTVQHVVDVKTDASLSPAFRDDARLRGFRSAVAVPLVCDAGAIGVVAATRKRAGGFTTAEIMLLQTFADQAVIAIENARLVTELKAKNADLAEALEQQTATSEILRMISGSPTDVQPVFDMLARSARQLCDGQFCFVLRFDGRDLQFAAADGLSPDGLRALQQDLPRPANEDTAAGRSIGRRAVAHVPDVQADPAYGALAVARAVTYRSLVAVPLLRDGLPIGAITVARAPVGLFPDRQVALLRTFADQAVIAIENGRLFHDDRDRLNGYVQKILQKGTYTREPLLAEVREMVASSVARRRSRP